MDALEAAAGDLGLAAGSRIPPRLLERRLRRELQTDDRSRRWVAFLPAAASVVVASGLLQIFDKDFVNRPIGVMAFSFLVGYFSDKALAKMADVADTLFGGTKKEEKQEEAEEGAIKTANGSETKANGVS